MIRNTGAAPIGVAGQANEQDTHDGDAPAVIVNPDASARTLMAWSLGQVEALRVMLVAAEDVDAGALSTGELASGAAALVEQVQAVLRAAVDRLPDES